MIRNHFLRAVIAHVFFFFNDTATTEIYTLSLHDALPISPRCDPTLTTSGCAQRRHSATVQMGQPRPAPDIDLSDPVALAPQGNHRRPPKTERSHPPQAGDNQSIIMSPGSNLTARGPR